VLARHCDAEGCDRATIATTIHGFGNPLDDVGAFLSSMEEYAKLGVALVEVMPPTPDPAGFVAELTEKVVPRLSEI
jgi:hypothetical protein